jgi:hypothetical protein
MQLETSELAALLRGTPQPLTELKCEPYASRDLGEQIVVLDRGFVYVGKVTIDGEFVTIANAKNIRYWGTKNGLGELRNGPLAETKLDEAGDVVTTLRAVIHFLKARGFVNG